MLYRIINYGDTGIHITQCSEKFTAEIIIMTTPPFIPSIIVIMQFFSTCIIYFLYGYTLIFKRFFWLDGLEGVEKEVICRIKGTDLFYSWFILV